MNYEYEPKNLREFIALFFDIVIGLTWKLLLISCCIKYLFY